MARPDDQVVLFGLNELRRNLRALDNGAQKEMRPAWNEAAKLLVDEVRPLVPVLTGKAQQSVRVASTQTQGRVRAGSKRVPYYAWLDFGGKVGRRRATRRPYRKDGRYLFPTLRRLRPRILAVAQREMDRLINKHGLG